MDSSSKWDVDMLMNELIQGMDQAGQLKVHLGSVSGSELFQVQDSLLQRVVSSFENALLLLQGIDLATQSVPVVSLDSGVVESSSVSMNNGGNNTPSDNSKPVFMDNQNLTSSSSKKRKTMQTWTEQVKLSAEHGLEGPVEDGYSWRKYGQKDIMGAKFPRSYYRCRHRAHGNCYATKQVQRSDELPTVFDITYRGFHTCNKSPAHAAANSPENIYKPKQTNVNINHQTAQLLMNFQSNTVESNINKDADFSFSFPSSWTWPENQFEQTSTLTADQECFSASFYTPIMPQPNYYSSSWNHNLQKETTFLQQYESELTDIISSDASANPTTSLPFSVDSVELDPKFLCSDISDFLSCLDSPKQLLIEWYGIKTPHMISSRKFDGLFKAEFGTSRMKSAPLQQPNFFCK